MPTYDWIGTDIIPNGSGSAVRADLNDAMLALFSQNSSATSPPETVAYMTWADTTTGLLKIRNAANSAWITVGTLADANLGLATLASPTFTGNVTVNAQGDLRLADSDSSNWVALHAPATVASNITLTVPSTVGTADQSLVTDGTGVLSFAVRSRLVSGTSVASTSGTSIDFTDIPSWVKRVTVMFNGVSTSGTSNLRIQTGAGSVTTSGYLGSSAGMSSNVGFSSVQAGSGFDISDNAVATAIRYGAIRFTNITGNTWVVEGVIGQSDTTRTAMIGGSIALSGTLDRVRITTVNGTDTFDAGSVNIIYEG
jgi:hypothetical protein